MLYEFDNNNVCSGVLLERCHVNLTIIMCVQLNKACCLLYKAFEKKSATYFTIVTFINKLIKSIPGMAEVRTNIYNT